MSKGVAWSRRVAASREESLDPYGIIYGVQNPLDDWLVQFLNDRVALPGALYPGNQSA